MTPPANLLFATVQRQSFDGLRSGRWRASRSTFEDVTFRAADLTGADFTGTTFIRCDFSGARLCAVDAHDCVFRSCRFDNANLVGIDLKSATIEATTLDGACFAGARLDGASFDMAPPRTDIDVDDDVSIGAIVGGVKLEDEVAGAMFNAIYRGATLVGPRTETLITIGSRIDTLSELRAELLYDVMGIAPMVAVATATSPSLARSVLFEQRPEGQPLHELAPMPESQVHSVLLAIAQVVEAAHELDVVLYGIHPRLCFATTDGGGLRFSGVAPRTMRFLLSQTPSRGGLCLTDVYLPVDVWRTRVVRDAPNHPADVFATCALGLFLLTGEHPFTGPTFDAAVAAVARGRYPFVEGQLGHLLTRGLAMQPADRPTASDLRAALEAL